MYTHTYLPDELGRQAKEAGLNLSGLLREAVERELGSEEGAARIETGVYRAGTNVEIRLNAAHRGRRNGVALVPSEPLPEPPQRRLRISVDALRRWLTALEG